MQARYFPWAIAGGACVTLAPGSALWIVPLVGAVAHMAYDADPVYWKEARKQLTTGLHDAQVIERIKALPLLGRKGDNGIDEDEDRALAVAALDHARKRAEAAPNDAKAQAKLKRLEKQARALYPDLLSEDRPQTPRARTAVRQQISEPDAFTDALTRVYQPTQERDPLLRTLEQEPHRLIIGRSRGGKTTLIHEMATNWASEGARVVVCDPDAMPGLWPGCTVVGHGNDTARIGQVLKVTAQEFERREALWGQGVREFQPIHLVIDEAHEVLPVIDGALETFEDLTRRGAKRAIHLTIGVQDKQISTLGLKGKSELLKNFIVADVLKDSQGQRKAVIQDAVTGKKTAWAIPAMRDPMSLAAQPVVAARMDAQPVVAALGETEKLPRPADTADDLLAGLLASAPPKKKTATATITRDGATINVYATATAEPAKAGPLPTKGRVYNRIGTHTNMKRRAAALKSGRKSETIEETYARLAAAGVPSFRQAYTQAGGGRDEALAAWRKAKGSTKP